MHVTDPTLPGPEIFVYFVPDYILETRSIPNTCTFLHNMYIRK